MNHAGGRSIHVKLRFLDTSQWWSRAQLEKYQLEKLQRLMRHVYGNVPFYTREMRSRGLGPDDFNSLDVLHRMPVVTKPMLKAHPEDFLARGESLAKLVVGSTSGSTGQPTKFYRSREQDSWHWALKYRMWGMAGYHLGMPYLNIYNMIRTGWKKHVQDLLLRNFDFYAFSGEPQPQLFDRVCDTLVRHRVKHLAGCTSTLKLLADHCVQRGAIGSFPLRAVLSTGSLLSDADREYMQRIFGAPLWDHYGLGGEGAHVAAECGQHRGYHVNVENLIVQPQDASTQTASAIAAPLIVTVLDNFAWPLIRYESGDAAVLSDRVCPCGRGLPLLERIDGRVSELLTLPNGTRVNVHFFSVLLGREPDVQQYQVQQGATGELKVRVVWKSQPVVRSKAAIIAAIRRAGGEECHVEVEDVAHIPLARSGKHRYVIPWSQNDPATVAGAL